MRDPYTIPVSKIKGTGWRSRAQCIDRDPDEYDLEGGTPRGEPRQPIARDLCEGCPVIRECAGEALEPLALGTVRAGVWITRAGGSGARDRVREALSEIALGEALPHDLEDLLAPLDHPRPSRASSAARIASAPASLTPAGEPPRPAPVAAGGPPRPAGGVGAGG